MQSIASSQLSSFTIVVDVTARMQFIIVVDATERMHVSSANSDRRLNHFSPGYVTTELNGATAVTKDIVNHRLGPNIHGDEPAGRDWVDDRYLAPETGRISRRLSSRV